MDVDACLTHFTGATWLDQLWSSNSDAIIIYIDL